MLTYKSVSQSNRQKLINPANHTILAMSAITTEQTTERRALSPTEQKIQELKAQANAKIAELRATGIRADLIKGVKSNPSMTDDELYTLAKPFTNLVERKRSQERIASGEAPKKRGKGKNAS